MYDEALGVMVITFPASEDPAVNHHTCVAMAVSLSVPPTALPADVSVVPVDDTVNVGVVVPVPGTAAAITRTVLPAATPAGIVIVRLVLLARPLSAFAPVT
jgi:hypothetical protein